MVVDVSLLNTQYYKVQIKGKWSNLEKGVAPSSSPRCCSYWKRNLRVNPQQRSVNLSVNISGEVWLRNQGMQSVMQANHQGGEWKEVIYSAYPENYLPHLWMWSELILICANTLQPTGPASDWTHVSRTIRRTLYPLVNEPVNNTNINRQD